MAGGVLSFTMIVWLAETEFPEQSVTVQIRIICPVPQGPMPLKSSEGGPVEVIPVSQLSDAVRATGGGMFPQETEILAGTEPVITGAVLSVREMVCVVVVMLPEQSEAVQVRTT